jgi:ribonuclease HI
MVPAVPEAEEGGMTYHLPETLSVLWSELTRRGVDVSAFKTERQAAFMIQQLFGTRFKFPAKGASCFPLLHRMQESLPSLANKASQVWDPSTIRSKRKVAANSQTLENRFELERLLDTGLVIFCDGACEPNPGVGGWGFVVYRDGVEIHAEHGGERVSTNNIMEMTGALMALRWTAGAGETRLGSTSPRILCDSQYVVKGCNDWRHGWKAKGWKRGQKPLANADLWRELDDALILVPITLEWVKGHAGTLGNERADELAEEGRQSVINRESFSASLIEKQLQYAI